VRPEIDSPVGKLQQQFVRLRIVNMAEVDVGLFDFDFDTTFALFIINADRNVYLRYGARTDAGADVMLSTKSLELALQRGLALHERWTSGDLKLPPPPQPLPAQSYPNVANVVKKNQCVHCHQVGEGKALELIGREGFDKKSMPWIFPDPARLGLHIDPDDGILLAGTSATAAAAGIEAGEKVQRVGETGVSTFADIQHALHQVPTGARRVSITTDQKTLLVALPPYWRVTDINRRSIGHRMTPFPEFWGKALSADEKKKLGVDPEGFATRVTKFWTNTHGKQAGMREGDLVVSVNGETKSPLAVNAMIYIRTHFDTGDEIRVRYRRGEAEAEAKFKLRAKPW
jgi:hypothetical protein